MAQSIPLQSSLVVDNESALENAVRIGSHQRPIGKIKLEPVLGVIDEILSWAKKSISDALDGKYKVNILTRQSVSAESFADAIGPLASDIHKISCELQCKCSGRDANKSTKVILEMLKNYGCGAKAVIATAAFALKYGEFCLFAKPYLGHPLARYVRILKHLPDIGKHEYTLQRLSVLIGVIVELARVTVQLDIPPLEEAMSLIDDYANLVILSVVVCTEQIASLAGVSTEVTTLSLVAELTLKANQVLINLQKSLRQCRAIIDKKKHKENFVLKGLKRRHVTQFVLGSFIITYMYKAWHYQ